MGSELTDHGSQTVLRDLHIVGFGLFKGFVNNNKNVESCTVSLILKRCRLNLTTL